MFKYCLVLVFVCPLVCSWLQSCIHCDLSGSPSSVQCPSILYSDYIALEATDIDRLKITCRASALSFNVSYLRDCDFSPVKFVQFNHCPFISESLAEVLAKIGIVVENLEYFGLTGAYIREAAIPSNFLKGLSNLMYFEIKNYNFSSLPSGLFSFVPKLEIALLSGNFIQSLPTDLFQNTLSITKIFLGQNQLSALPPGLFNNLKNLTHLYLDDNQLSSFPSNIFGTNKKLKVLHLSKNSLTELPDAFLAGLEDLEVLSLHSSGLLSFADDFLVYNIKLTSFDIQSNNLTTLPSHMFSNNLNLNNIYMQNNNILQVPNNLFVGLEKLKKLYLSGNQLKNLPEYIFRDLVQMEEVFLNDNLLQEIPTTLFHRCRRLKRIYLQDNHIKSLGPSHFSLDNEVEEFNIANNNLIFEKYEIDSIESINPFNLLVNLKRLDLSNNQIDVFHPDFGIIYRSLQYINLSFNKITNLDLSNIVQSFVEIDVRHNEISSVIKFNSFIFNKTVELRLASNPLNCDCLMFNVLNVNTNSTFIISILDMDEARCSLPENLSNHTLSETDPKHLVCPIESTAACPSPCTCSRREYMMMFTIDCSSKNLVRLPDMKILNENSNRISQRYFDGIPFLLINTTLIFDGNNLTSLEGLGELKNKSVFELSIENNKISVLNVSHLPLGITVLNLKKNNLTYLPQETLLYLNSSVTKLSLSDNPWICGCETIEDYHLIYCYSLDKAMSQVTIASLCPFTLTTDAIAAIIAVAVLLVTTSVVGVIAFYKYQNAIKVWLYANRLCLWFIRETEVDSDKKYDAFISFSHKDEHFVNSILVPGLEAGDPKYNVCLHYRDWMPGEEIPMQIVKSVSDSRRTIVILSNNFLESIWAREEFKAAHKQALEDKINRVILIVYGEVPEKSKLDDDLKTYVSLYTYLKWGDQRFWDKLRYAMPHPKHLNKHSSKKHNLKNEDKVEMSNSFKSCKV